MSLEVGSVVTGKVTGLAKFGAFVALPGGTSGLVHISEVANTFIANVEEHLSVGQQVKVKILSVDEKGRVNLSIKQAEEKKPEVKQEKPRQYQPRQQAPSRPSRPPQEEVLPKSENRDFEDTLKKFLQDADSKISESRLYDRQRSTRRKGGRK